VDAIEGKLAPELVKKFAFEREVVDHGGVPRRASERKVLDLGALCTNKDLMPESEK